jgi:adenine/guanine phosphoribosyltransferase-like PRPP-binding protein
MSYCECPAAGFCSKHQFVKSQRDFELCKGINCTTEVANSYRKAWDQNRTAQQQPKAARGKSVVTVQNPTITVIPNRGSALSSLTADDVPCKYRGEELRMSGCTACGTSGLTSVFSCSAEVNAGKECTLIRKINGVQDCSSCVHGVDAFEKALESHHVPNKAVPMKGSEGPGTELLAIYKKMGFPECPDCTSLAARMDELGTLKCISQIDMLIEDILPRAKGWISTNQPWVTKWVPSGVTDKILRGKIRLDILAAVKAVRAKEKAIRVKSKGNSWMNAFKYVNSDEVRFLTTSQMSVDTKKLVSMLPPDITAIAGVSRSGVYPASLAAMMLHLPFYVVRQSTGDVIEAGSGWRLGKKSHDGGKVAVIDDTVMTGNSQKAIKEVVEDFFDSSMMCTVYCNPLAIHKPDLWAVDLPWPHLLEWNLFNSVVLPSTAMDFDGILCNDCLPGQDDDGEKYLDFIRNAIPKYVVRKDPISLIVTARLEKYREPTLEWLSKWGIKCNNLVMAPYSTLAERQRQDMAKFKAKHFKEFMGNSRGIKPCVFVESDVNQAIAIAKYSGGISVCPAAGKCFKG